MFPINCPRLLDYLSDLLSRFLFRSWIHFIALSSHLFTVR